MASGSTQLNCAICGAPIDSPSEPAAAYDGPLCAACRKAVEGKDDDPPVSKEEVAAVAGGPQATASGPTHRTPPARCPCGEPMQMALRPRHGAGVRIFCAVLGVDLLLSAIFVCLAAGAKQHVSEAVAVGVVIGAFGSAWLGIAMLVIAGEKQPWLECPACGRAELAAAWVYQRVQESGAQPIQ